MLTRLAHHKLLGGSLVVVLLAIVVVINMTHAPSEKAHADPCQPSSWCSVGTFGSTDNGNIHRTSIIYEQYDASDRPTGRYYAFGYEGTRDGTSLNNVVVTVGIEGLNTQPVYSYASTEEASITFTSPVLFDPSTCVQAITKDNINSGWAEANNCTPVHFL